jgi:hypothetical protein
VLNKFLGGNTELHDDNESLFFLIKQLKQRDKTLSPFKLVSNEICTTEALLILFKTFSILDIFNEAQFRIRDTVNLATVALEYLDLKGENGGRLEKNA